MKKIYALLFSLSFVCSSFAQTVCNPSGNLMIFTDYDGGILNINVDVNIPNLKIGVCSYEAIQINISGAFANNVTAVSYAGYNGTNDNCGLGVVATSISGTSGTSVNTIQFAPPVTLTNPNGYGSVICASSCSTTTYQGGCNTVDQIEAFFLNAFPGSALYAHKVQYACWLGTATYTISGGGTCCPLTTGITNASTIETNVYPNPATDKLVVESAEKIKSVQAIDCLGRITELKILSETVDISTLSNGLYFLNIVTENDNIIKKKFVKE
ncbi:hypothetical protein BH10BAC1_BH10BAC1_17670 [soil metagenome]